MWDLVRHGRAGDDPAFWLTEFAPPHVLWWISGQTTTTRAGVYLEVRSTPPPTTRTTVGTWWSWRATRGGGAEKIEAWAKRHGERRVFECNTGAAARMGPATGRLYQAVTAGTVSHDGDRRLASHIANTVANSTAHGDLVTKDRRNSPRKIAAIVGAIIAFDRAAAAQRAPVGHYAAVGF